MFDVGHNGVANLTDESRHRQLWSDFRSTGGSARNGEKAANGGGSQLTDTGNEGQVVKGQCEQLVCLLVRSLLLQTIILASGILCEGGCGYRRCRLWLSVLAEVLWLVLGKQVVQGADHVGQEAVVFASNGCCQYTIFVAEEMCVVDIEGGELEELHASYLRDVVFVCCRSA